MEKEVKALNFEEALEKSKIKTINNIPFFVVEVVNDMITDKLRKIVVDNDSSKDIKFHIGQDDLVDNIIRKIDEMPSSELPEKYQPFKRSDIFNKKWLDFEPLYREEGWFVKYEKELFSVERNSNYWIFRYKRD